MIQKIKKEKEQFKLSDPPSVQVQCDNDPDNERDPGEPGDQVVSSRDPMLSSISPDNTKMWRSLSSESMDDAESLVYYKVGVTTQHSQLTMSTLTPHVSTGPEAQISEEGASQDSQAEQPPEAGAA